MCNMIDFIDSGGKFLTDIHWLAHLVCRLEFEPTLPNHIRFKRMITRFILVLVLTDLIFLLVESVSSYKLRKLHTIYLVSQMMADFSEYVL